MYVVEGVQALLDLLRVLLVLGVGREQLLGRCYSGVIPTNGPLKVRGEGLTPLASFGGWVSGSRSASMRLGTGFLHSGGLGRHCASNGADHTEFPAKTTSCCTSYLACGLLGSN